jgi:hypothetical protein
LIRRIHKIRLTPPQLANLFIVACVIFMIGNYNNWDRGRKVIDNDVVSYYAYLPSLFIYHDVTLKFVKDYKGPHRFEFWPLTAPNGGYYHKTAMGLAYCYAPFFFAAHGYAYLFGYDTGGYSPPYHIALLISALFFAAAGLFFLRKTLEFFFDNTVVAIVLLLTVFGTNLFYYITIEAAMSHSFSFGLISAFVYYSLRWHQSQKYLTTIKLGLLLGWIVFIRPTNIIIVLFPLLYNINSIKDVKGRVSLFLGNFKQLFIILFCMILFWIPQLFYWKTVTGDWFFSSYGDEGFFFLKPQIINGLFGFRKGWFIYTPLMIFAVMGLAMSFKRLKPVSTALLVFMIINLWITFSWWCWWYGGGLSQRSLVDTYALMAIPLGVFISWLWKRKYLVKLPGTIVILALVLLTGFYTIQYRFGGLHYNSMTKKAWFENFGHIEPHGNYWKLLQCPDYDKAKKGIQDTVKCD